MTDPSSRSVGFTPISTAKVGAMSTVRTRRSWRPTGTAAPMNEIGTESVIAFGVACSAVGFPGDHKKPGAGVKTAKYGSDAGMLLRHRTAALSVDVASVAAVNPIRTPTRFIP